MSSEAMLFISTHVDVEEVLRCEEGRTQQLSVLKT